jgi:5-methyltetrahydrofolate--homocysteine methyltransferase
MKMMNCIGRIERNMLHWWEHRDFGRPIVRIVGCDGDINYPPEPEDMKDFHTNPAYQLSVAEAYTEKCVFFGEAFRNIDVNIGPGSMAVYLGSEPMFRRDTVWFTETAKNSLSDLGELRFDPENKWWKYHLEVVGEAARLCKGTPFIPDIPDIIENIDILAILRGPQPTCFDLMDEPESVRKYIGQVDDWYFNYYDAMYDLVKNDKGGCSYTAFAIVAPEKCAKIQCDFNVMMSPGQFREFIVPSLTKQCEKIPYTIFHLDGPEAIKHADALMGIEKLNALNWTPGAGKPDGGDERWYPLYDKVIGAGKSLWISMDQGGLDRFISRSRKIVERYGHRGMYFIYPDLPVREAEKLYASAERNFK